MDYSPEAKPRENNPFECPEFLIFSEESRIFVLSLNQIRGETPPLPPNPQPHARSQRPPPCPFLQPILSNPWSIPIYYSQPPQAAPSPGTGLETHLLNLDISRLN